MVCKPQDTRAVGEEVSQFYSARSELCEFYVVGGAKRKLPLQQKSPSDVTHQSHKGTALQVALLLAIHM